MYKLIILKDHRNKGKLKKIWYKDKCLHRKNGPAVYTNEKKQWYFLGKAHRDNDLPAYDAINRKQWHIHGMLHRENDLPAVECANGDKQWWYQGKRHRIGNPAIVYNNDELEAEYWENDINYNIVEYPNGTKEWRAWNNFLHRDNFPAVIYPNGDCEWWVEGVRHRIGGPAVVIGDKQYFFEDGEFVKCIV
jgi:hypothetical protein